MLNKKTIYIAGPMRGYHEYNFQAFHDADEVLSKDWKTINPAKIDIDDGFDPKTPQHTLTGKDLEDFIVRDIHLVLSADAIVVLQGWEKSRGVAVEVAIARYSDIPIYVYPEMVLIGNEDKEVSQEGIKYDGDKVRMALVIDGFAKALNEIGKVATFGAEKYEDNNWMLITDTNRYKDAMYRHLGAEAQGEECDPESGLLHVAHAAWNVLAILHFIIKEREGKNGVE